MFRDRDDDRPLEAAILFNPRAARAERWRETLRSGLARLGVRRWCETEGPGHACELARAAASDGVGLILAGGGDGTVHEIANGLLGSRVAFFPLPLGTGNDVVRSLGLPRSVPAALDSLEHRRSYTRAVVRTFLSYEPAEIEVVGSHTRFRGRALSVSIANGSCVGGGYRIAPEADPSDGRLDICIFEPVGPLQFVRWFAKVRRGRHGDVPVFHTWRDTRVTLRADSLAAHLDGEVRAYPPGSEVSVEVLPGALRVWA
ncbi:MAG: diacylglycerol/lipid kinase family protein [Gemmatimonadota bacterium]